MADLKYHDVLKAARKRLGITQRQAAEKIEVSERAYVRFENGQRNIKRWELNGLLIALKGRD